MDSIQLLNSLFQTVKQNFTYRSDKEQYKRDELWMQPIQGYIGKNHITGDCEDFALACRRLCRNAGIKNSRLVICKTESQEMHCVLEADGYVFDNRMNSVVTREDLDQRGYTWIAISGYEPGEPWHFVEKD